MAKRKIAHKDLPPAAEELKTPEGVPAPFRTSVSTIRDDVLRMIRAETMLDERNVRSLPEFERAKLRDQESQVYAARNALVDAATWLPAATPADALFQLSLINEIVGRMSCVDGVEALSEPAAERLSELEQTVERMLFSVARVIEGMVPGVTLKGDGVGWHFLSSRCDRIGALCDHLTAATPLKNEEAATA